MTNLQAENINDQLHFLLPPKLGLPEAVEAKEQLLDAVKNNKGIVLDFKNVQEIKTPFIQVMITGFNYFSNKEVTFNIKNIGAGIKENFAILALQNELEKMENIEK